MKINKRIQLKRERLAKLVLKIVNSFYIYDEHGYAVNEPEIVQRIERLLKRHGI